MDERENILQGTVDRLIETALRKLDQEEAIASGEAELSRISDQILRDTQLGGQHQVTRRQCRHLYCQGAQDCVLLLRRLGVIQ